MFNTGKCKLFVWLKLGSQKDIQENFSKTSKRDQYLLMFILDHSPFQKKRKTPCSLELVVPFSAHYVAKQEPKLQYKGGFCL